jgi:hypothetical protein
MLKICEKGNKLVEVSHVTLPGEQIRERDHLQLWISNSFEDFCHEIGQPLQLVGTEVKPSTKNVGDRIDLLALDEDGNAVIIELKRSHNKLQLLQAVAYASMIWEWKLADFKETAGGARWDDIADFLPDDIEEDDINQKQRVILVAEEYDYEVLVSAKWLREIYGMDITCLRLEMAKDSSGAPESRYLVFTQVYPPRELAEIAVRRRSPGQAAAGRPDEKFLATVDAYNATAPLELQARGTAPAYRMIHPADWPFTKFLAYCILRTRDGISDQLMVHKDAEQRFVELAKGFAGKTIANGAELLWEEKENVSWGAGRLSLQFPATAPAETIAEGMQKLIAMTRPKVSEEIKASSAPIS